MAIVIKDLNKSKDMDRKAMLEVIGGSSAKRMGRVPRDRLTLFLPSPLKLISQRSDSGIS